MKKDIIITAFLLQQRHVEQLRVNTFKKLWNPSDTDVDYAVTHALYAKGYVPEGATLVLETPEQETVKGLILVDKSIGVYGRLCSASTLESIQEAFSERDPDRGKNLEGNVILAITPERSGLLKSLPENVTLNLYVGYKQVEGEVNH